MAQPTPWQLAQPTSTGTVKKTPVYAFDPYNFSHITTTNGTNPAVTIPAVGPNAIGAIFPTSARTIVSVQVTVTGTNPNPGYGNNFGAPAAPALPPSTAESSNPPA